MKDELEKWCIKIRAVQTSGLIKVKKWRKFQPEGTELNFLTFYCTSLSRNMLKFSVLLKTEKSSSFQNQDNSYKKNITHHDPFPKIMPNICEHKTIYM